MTWKWSPLVRLTMVTVLAVSGTVLSTLTSVNAAVNPAPVPVMLVRANDSSTVYVVSTTSYFDPAHPAACDPQACYLLKRTTNNGASFTVMNLPHVGYLKNTIAGTLEDLVFANPRDGYALVRDGVFSTLFVTSNGASTWHRQTITPGEHVLLLIANQGQLYALIARCASNHTCTHLRAARSTLSARRWTVTALPRGLPHAFYSNYFGVTAFGSNVWLTLQGSKTPLLYISHNRGTTFTSAPAPSLGSVTACSLTAESQSSLWATCPTGMMVSFFYSGDAGAQWVNVDRLGYAGTGGGYFDPVSSSLAYLDYGQTGPSRPENLFRITNAGRTSLPAGVLHCDDVFGLVFTDARHGLAICNHHSTLASTYLLRTSDGGSTWSQAAAFYERF